MYQGGNIMNDQPTQPQADSTINLADLQNILVVLDLASSRGAFRGAELEPVGQLYNKFKKFVDAAAAQQTADQPQSNAAPDDGITNG
jgi:hypothetical protein